MKTLFLLFTLMGLLCHFTNASDESLQNQAEESFESLKNRNLVACNSKEKTSIIQQIANLKGDRASNFLFDYYRSYPSANISRDYESEPKMSAFVAILARLESKDKSSFLMECFWQEVRELKQARKIKFERDYPRKLWNTILLYIEKERMAEDMLETFHRLSRDKELPDVDRTSLLALALRVEFASNGKSRAANISFILGKVPPRPTMPIPWDIYNVKEKRIKLSEPSEVVEWRLSGRAVETEAYENVLTAYDVESVSQIVTKIGRNSVAKKQDDYLASVAADILAGLKSKNMEKWQSITNEISLLEDYVDNMEDLGAGCYRNQAIIALYIFYRKMKITNYREFKEGGNVLETVSRGGEDAPPVTNSISLACNTKTNNMSKVIKKSDTPNARNIGWMLITLTGILLTIVALLMSFKKGRIRN